MYQLKEGLANKFEIKSENIIIGAGSDQIISFALHAKANKNNAILMAKITFAMYEIYGRQTGAKILKTKSDEHNLKELLQLYKANKNISVIFLCLPNNPLGESLNTQDVYEFLDEIDKETLVIIDGAYQEYAKYKDKNKEIIPKDLISKYPNTLYLGTFSKAYGLGGMRCGYGIGNTKVIKALHKLRSPFNITTLSLKAGIAALSDEKFVENSVKENFSQMVRFEDFAKENSFDFIPSYTNFITLKFDNSKISSQIAQNLLKKGIIVRDLSAYGMNAIRVTIGTPKQNSSFFKIYKTLTR
jgi:histidinol-phosphate aminotransferase